MAVPSTNILDHIIHLTPPGTVAEAAKQFQDLGFNVIPGGTHADGLTANSLVVLADGVYLELISFTHPVSHYPPSSPERTKREAHWWASKQPGWIDFSHLGTTTTISDIINERATKQGSGVVYQAAVPGGRERPDGKVLKWHVTFPDIKHGRGFLPFFCGDATPREWRVPSEPPSNTVHPSAAQGIAYVRLLAGKDDFSRLSNQLTSVLGDPPVETSDEEVAWELRTLASVTRTGGDNQVSDTRLILSVPKSGAELEAVQSRGPGIFEVAFWVKSEKKGAVDTPYGRIVWLPVE